MPTSRRNDANEPNTLTHYSLLMISLLALLLAACGNQASEPASTSAVTLEPGQKLRVVATTNIVADVVRQVGGENIELHRLLPVGVDPHSYSATPDDLRALTDAHVVFVNGLGLEEAMGPVLKDFEAKTVSVNDGVDVRLLEEEDSHEDEHGHGEGVDPHTWFSVPAVKVWVQNIEATLSTMDPAHAEAYRSAAAAYIAELDALHAEILDLVAQVPPDRRKLVTDHDVFGYFADTYGFQIVATVIPSLSTIAEPSAQQLAALQEQVRQEGVQAIFVGNTINPKLAEELARDLGIRVVTVYTGSLSGPDGPAATYVDFMRTNVRTIVEALGSSVSASSHE